MIDGDNDLVPEPESSDMLALTEAYIPGGVSHAAMIHYQYRFAALVWLHRTVTGAIDRESETLRRDRAFWKVADPEWEQESADALDESAGILREDADQVGAGMIVLACCSAIESLLTTMLSGGRGTRGLLDKAKKVADVWPDLDERSVILDHMRWLAARRNSFAHRLLDEGGAWETNPTATTYEFGREAVEEAFRRAGELASILDEGYEEFILLHDGQ